MLTTTLNKIQEHSPCTEGWKKLLKSLGKTKADDDVLSLEYILESNGLDDALWALRAVDGYQNAMRLYTCYCAKRVLHIYEKKYPNDNRVRTCIETAESFAYGNSTSEDLDAAKDAAWAAAKDAAWVAAKDAAWVAAKVATWDTTWDTVWTAAKDAAWVAAKVATWDTTWDDFSKEFIRLCRLEGEYGEVQNG